MAGHAANADYSLLPVAPFLRRAVLQRRARHWCVRSDASRRGAAASAAAATGRDRQSDVPPAGGADRENQRRSVMVALAQNNCGPQYANAARAPGGFLDTLFGNNPNPTPGVDLGPAAGTFRTVCVRSCDGAYFPVSFATVPARFPDDEKTCNSLCPPSEASLYSYRNPAEDMNQAV